MSGKIGPENKFMHFVALSLVRSKAIILTLSVICVLLLPLYVVVLCLVPCADPEGEGAGVLDPPPWKYHKNIGFLAILVRIP